MTRTRSAAIVALTLLTLAGLLLTGAIGVAPMPTGILSTAAQQQVPTPTPYQQWPPTPYPQGPMGPGE